LDRVDVSADDVAFATLYIPIGLPIGFGLSKQHPDMSARRTVHREAGEVFLRPSRLKRGEYRGQGGFREARGPSVVGQPRGRDATPERGFQTVTSAIRVFRRHVGRGTPVPFGGSAQIRQQLRDIPGDLPEYCVLLAAHQPASMGHAVPAIEQGVDKRPMGAVPVDDLRGPRWI
jgi:hypothetical protein